MPFVTVPEDRFLTDILKTWITFFSSDVGFAQIPVRPDHPDVDTAFQLSCLVVKRVPPENWSLARLSGHHGSFPNADDAEVSVLKGYTYDAQYQFDVLAKSIAECNRVRGLVLQKLKNPAGGDVFANDDASVLGIIPVKDFSSPTSPTGTATNLRIMYRFKDVSEAMVGAFDPQLHQYSVVVPFWVHYLKEYELPKIQTITQASEVSV